MSRTEIVEIIQQGKDHVIDIVDQLIKKGGIRKEMRIKIINAALSMNPKDHYNETDFVELFYLTRIMFVNYISNSRPEQEPKLSYLKAVIEIRKELFCIGGSECLQVTVVA